MLSLFQWYRQNRELKRRSQVIAQKILESNPEGLPDVDLSDEVDSNNEDLEQLRETVRGISGFLHYGHFSTFSFSNSFFLT